MHRGSLRHHARVWVALSLVFLGSCSSSAGRPTLPASPTATIAQPGTTASPTITAAQPSATADRYLSERQAMIADTIVARGVSDSEVLKAMEAVPRERFVPETYLSQAYADHPLPIGYGQTISQPYIVAWMTELLELRPGDKVLEIGTGSGYQAAVLAEIEGVEVYTIEIVPELAAEAAARLEQLGHTEVRATQGDGYYGWEAHAPFDAIIVTAAPDHLPQPLVAQLREGGRIVIPIGPPGGWQDLWRFTLENDELSAQNLGGVIFVPFTGEGTGQPTP